jgi:hypothetical protein
MPQREMKNNTQVVHCGNLSLSGATPAASDWVDTRDFDSCLFVLVNNTVTDAGTAAGFSFEVQEGDDTTDAGASAVADAQLEGLESALDVTDDAADNAIAGTIAYLGSERYARIEATGTTGTDADISVIAILQHGHSMPDDAGVGTAVAAT